MGLDPLSILEKIVDWGFKIMGALEKADHNAEGCRRIGDLLRRLSAIAEHLKEAPEAMADASMKDATEGLKEALQHASKLVEECDDKGFLRRAFKADDIAEKLRGVCLDVLLHLSVVIVANGALNTSMLAELKENVAQLRADVTYTNSMFAKILQILAAQPDVQLPKEVAELVQDYKNSTEYATSQNENRRETAKTGVVDRPEVNIQKNNGLEDKKAPHASSSGLAESASAVSMVGQYDSSSTIINKASSSISKLVGEAQSVGVSAAPFHPQKIISISKEPGETGRYKIHSHPSKTSKLLEVYPQQLLFPLEPKNKETTRCPVTLTNKTDHYVGIWIKPINGRFTKTDIMEPHSTLVVYATMKMHAQPPKDTVKFEVLMIIVQSKGDHRKLESSIGGELNMDGGFMAHVEKLKAEVYRAILTAITCDPESCQIISRSIENMTLTSIDAHPTKTWIVTGYEEGNFSIWDYQKQEIVMKLQVNEEPGKFARDLHAVFQYFNETPLRHSVWSAKFTAEGKCLVVGDGNGYIYVYGYTDTNKLYAVKKFRAHDKSVDSLAAHPTEPYLLSSSAFDRNIKLWDWSKNWKEIQNFYVEPKYAYVDSVRSVKFNPRDTNTFACVTYDDRVKVWNIRPSSLETTLKGPCVKADYFFTRSHQHLMVTLRFDSHNSEIWDLKTGKVVHTLSVSGRKTTWVACHPNLPILVTTLDDGTVCLWDASTYRLEKMVHITNSECCDLVFVPDTNGLTRLAVAFKTMIAIMEINLPIANTSNASGPVAGASYE